MMNEKISRDKSKKTPFQYYYFELKNHCIKKTRALFKMVISHKFMITIN